MPFQDQAQASGPEPRLTVRFMQAAAFSRQAAALPLFSERTGIEVALDLLPSHPYWYGVRHAFGSAPAWDLLVPDEVIVAEQIHRGLLEPLGRRAHRAGMDLDDFLQSGIDRFRASDVVYAIPYLATSNVLIYRRDILERYGFSVPDSWDELRRVATDVQTALRQNDVTDIVGFVGRGAAGYGHNFWIAGSTLFPSWGWNWNRGAGQPPLVDEPATVAALDFYAALLRESGPPDAAHMTAADAHRCYAEGKAVFLLDTASALATMRRADPAGPGQHSAIALVPTGPTGRREPGLSSPAFCIPASSPVKDAAWELLRFLLSPEELLKDAVEAGYAEPARQSVVDSEAYAAAYDAEFRQVLAQTRRYARINRPLIPYGFDLGEIVGVAVESVIAGERPAADALRAAQDQIDAMSWTI